MCMCAYKAISANGPFRLIKTMKNCTYELDSRCFMLQCRFDMCMNELKWNSCFNNYSGFIEHAIETAHKYCDLENTLSTFYYNFNGQLNYSGNIQVYGPVKLEHLLWQFDDGGNDNQLLDNDIENHSTKELIYRCFWAKMAIQINCNRSKTSWFQANSHLSSQVIDKINRWMRLIWLDLYVCIIWLQCLIYECCIDLMRPLPAGRRILNRVETTK